MRTAKKVPGIFKTLSTVTRRRQPLATWMAFGVLTASILVIIQACEPPGPGPDGNATPVIISTPSVTAVPNPPHLGFATVQYCADSTGSYPANLFQAANNYIADSINAGIQANEAGFNLYVTYINADPTNPASTPLVFLVPAQLPYPTQPPSPTPFPPNNQGFKNPPATATAATQATLTAWDSSYPSADATITASVNSAKSALASKITTLRNLPKYSSPFTSVWGCLYEASERFGNAQAGDKWLVIASDMQNNSSIDITKINLHGVKVRVIDFYCSGSSGGCQNTQNQWTSIFVQAGAARGDIHFDQPAETQTLPLLFSGNA